MFIIFVVEYLDCWFESELIKVLFGFDGIVGNYVSFYVLGIVYVLLYYVFG